MKHYADLLFQYLTRKKYLYRILGSLAFGYLILELSIPRLPKEVMPDYEKFKCEYGEFPAMVLGYLIDKHASGPSGVTISILLFLIVFCLYTELRINAKNSGNRNFFFGLFQNINQTFNDNK